MPNSYYNHSTYPAPNAPGSSAALRSELDLVTAAFNLLPTLTGNGYKVAMINAGGTALVASATLQSLAITGSTLDSTPIGATTRAAGSFTNLSVNGSAGLGTAVTIGGGTINNTPIGGTTASSGAFTSVSASSGFTGNLTGNVTGDVTGNLTGNVSGNVTAGSGTSTFNNVSINGTLDMNAGTTGTITGLANPVNASDAANKGYVDMVAQGLDVKASARVATTANITLSGTQTIDGVALSVGDRVLVKDQSTASTNGLYVVESGSWTRSTDMDVWTEFPGAFFFVEQGTTHDNSGWVCTVSQGGTLGATAVTFEQFSGAGQIDAGAGMTKTGNQLNVGTASASRIVVNADNIDLAASGVTASTYKSVTVDIYGRVTAGTNPTTLAGYGIADAYTKTEVDSILGSATAASISAAAAAASELAAGNSATAASGSASSASASAAAAAASLDSFDDRYLGAKTSDPTVDNDGNALITGALYFNSVSGTMKVYDGAAWVAAYLPAAGYVPISGGTMTGNLTIANGTDSRVNLQVSGVTEGILTASAANVRLSSANAIPITIGTNGVTRLTFTGTGFVTTGASEYVGIGQQAGTNNALRVARNLTNDTSAFGVLSDGTFQSGVTNVGMQYRSIARTAAASFTMAGMYHYQAFQAALGAGSAITTQAGFVADASLIGATNNYGFRGQIAQGTDRWNLYMDGTAANYMGGDAVFNGKIGIGSSGSPNYGTSGQAMVSGGASAAPAWGDVVTPTGTQTLTNKTLTAPESTGSIYNNGSVRGSVVAVAALNVDCTIGNYFTKTISTNSTFTFSSAPASRSYAFTLELTHTSGTVTWPSGVQWPGGTAPTLATSKTHLFMFVTDDGGTRWRGAALADYTN